METELARIASIAQEQPKARFTSLVHLINEETLEQCHRMMEAKKAPGIDGVSKFDYDENLKENLTDLVARMKRQAYKPQAVRRVHIPKPGSNKMRPLGIPAYEDKLVQAALAKILTAIYEKDFLNCSWGFRPGRGTQDALKVVNHVIEKRRVHYIVDADIKGFFDHVDHEWMITFLKERIADPNLLRLIQRFLKAGVMEAGIVYDTPEGTPQGGVVSPVLANVYLHYVLDLWFEKIIKRKCRGDAFMVRYADDFVCCFQHKEEAQAFYQALIVRLKKFNLEVAEEKTRIIAFGPRAEDQAKTEGKDKPDTFDFLGFTHYCGKSRHGKFRVKRKTCRKKFRMSIRRFIEWLKENRTLPMIRLLDQLNRKVKGYYQAYGLTDNMIMLSKFKQIIQKELFKWLNRRSQRRGYTVDKFARLMHHFPLPKPRIHVNIYDLPKTFLLSCK